MPTTAAAPTSPAHRFAGAPLPSGRGRGQRWVWWLPILSLAGMLMVSLAAAETAPGPVFAGIAAAFEASEASQLASLVHPDGLRVTGHGERTSHYSPSQAVYFFRNLFEGQRTLLFSFLKSQDDARGDHARGMATWKRRRLDSERVIEVQLVIVLARDGDRWRLAELNIIR
jgi:hypothetical protein